MNLLIRAVPVLDTYRTRTKSPDSAFTTAVSPVARRPSASSVWGRAITLVPELEVKSRARVVISRVPSAISVIPKRYIPRTGHVKMPVVWLYALPTLVISFTNFRVSFLTKLLESESKMPSYATARCWSATANGPWVVGAGVVVLKAEQEKCYL